MTRLLPDELEVAHTIASLCGFVRPMALKGLSNGQRLSCALTKFVCQSCSSRLLQALVRWLCSPASCVISLSLHVDPIE